MEPFLAQNCASESRSFRSTVATRDWSSAGSAREPRANAVSVWVLPTAASVERFPEVLAASDPSALRFSCDRKLCHPP